MTVIKAKKVNIELMNRDGEITEDTFLVRKLRFDKMTQALDEIHTVYDLVTQDEKLRLVFEELFGEEDTIDPAILENFSEEEQEEMKAERFQIKQRKFLEGVMGSFNVLLVHLPKKAGDLLAVMAQMDRDLLGQQEVETVLDIYDAVLKVNDLETLLERGKLSLAVTRQAVAFLNKRRESNDLIKH